jgi:hypothetical protein
VGRLSMFMGLMLSVLLLSACTDAEESREEPSAAPERAEPDTDVTEHGEAAAVHDASLSTVHVQDLWLFEDVEVVASEGTRDVSSELFTWLESAVDEVVDLPGDATLHLVDALDAGLLGPDEQPREDVDVVGGYLEFEGARALAILGTSHEGAAPIGYQDHLDLDLTAVQGVEAGDVLTYRLAFLQAMPTGSPEEAAGLNGVEMLAERLEAGSYLYAGYRTDEGEVEPGYFEGELAAVVDGSDRARPPAKAHDMIDGMGDAVSDCQAFECIRDWFRNLGPDGGGGSSWDNALCNGNIGSTCPPNDPPTPDSICLYPPCGSTHGDPYLTPYDGGIVNFHLVGEFVLTAGDDLEVQVRMEPASPRGLAWNTGVAIGSDERRLTVVYDDGEVVSRVDGEPVAARGLEAALQDAGWTASVLDDTRLQVTTEQGHTVTVLLRLGNNRFLDAYVDLEGEPRGFVGLLGAAHPDEAPGFVSRDGEELGRQIANRSLRYGVLGESWRLSNEESLFDYAEGESTATFTDLDFPPEGGVESDELDRDDPEVARAEAICRAAGVDDEPILGHCILDLWATGDLAVVRSALTAERTRQVRDGEVDGEVFAPWSAWDVSRPLPDGAVEVDWVTTVRSLVQEFGLDVGDVLTVACPPAGDGRTDTRIWGTDVYWTTSPVCASAVHAGHATLDDGGSFEVEILEEVNHPDIEVEPRNGIDPDQWARQASGFQMAG